MRAKKKRARGNETINITRDGDHAIIVGKNYERLSTKRDESAILITLACLPCGIL